MRTKCCRMAHVSAHITEETEDMHACIHAYMHTCIIIRRVGSRRGRENGTYTFMYTNFKPWCVATLLEKTFVYALFNVCVLPLLNPPIKVITPSVPLKIHHSSSF